MKPDKKVRTSSLVCYYGLMAVLAFMVIVGPSTAAGISANVTVTTVGSSPTQSGPLDFMPGNWYIQPFNLSGPSIHQTGASSYEMSNMSLSCWGDLDCGPITVEAKLYGVSNPGIFSLDIDGFLSSDYGPGITATGEFNQFSISYWAYAVFGSGSYGISDSLSQNYGSVIVPLTFSNDLTNMGVPDYFRFGFTIDGMTYGDYLDLGNSFNINVNTQPSSVPEPSSFVLFGGGLIGLGLLRRRLHKR
ncbi:PEP-CTERM sorting domain-containing protein [Paludibaculum fermentans]|uniref:PEP-CTERM sorting domain-containing protein n=1 Tax=Paludibaculum fermentans TaxID=1473598 RepID=A0A7S7NKK8_PALFE|nr:PEP-CTERM sorting domain-containing protein [Paludibaculum fermentans]QOY85363.1 PEP-CTERM sorting domain-containing protein [Paludibaculum fermentans]